MGWTYSDRGDRNDRSESVLTEMGFQWAYNPAMPIFEYACNACGHQFEFLKLPAATTVPSCPACQSPNLTRLLSGFALSTPELTKARAQATRKQQLESKDYKDQQVARAEERQHHR
jgi:putative FmdB family regulatory protein